MNTTAGSSAPYQNSLDRTVPSRWQPQLRADLTELQMYRAAKIEGSSNVAAVPDPDKILAMQARARHAGTTHSNDIHRAIDAMVEVHRPQLASWTGTDTARAIWLTRRIYPDGAIDKAGRPCGWRTVYNHLKTLSF